MKLRPVSRCENPSLSRGSAPTATGSLVGAPNVHHIPVHRIIGHRGSEAALWRVERVKLAPSLVLKDPCLGLAGWRSIGYSSKEQDAVVLGVGGHDKPVQWESRGLIELVRRPARSI